MGTRAYICMENSDGTVIGTYCSLNGGLEQLGRILGTRINTVDLVKKLISYGGINCLLNSRNYKELITNYPLSDYYYEEITKYTYVRLCKRGKRMKPEVNTSIYDFTGGMINYCYLYKPQYKQWYYVKSGYFKNEIRPLRKY